METPGWVVGGIILFFMIMIIGIVLIVSKTFAVIGMIILILSVILMVGCVTIENPTGEYTYQVTFDDNVSINEIYEKYEIISQEGKIWEIKEKDEN